VLKVKFNPIQTTRFKNKEEQIYNEPDRLKMNVLIIKGSIKLKNKKQTDET
jgi:hypothetical protein